MAKPLRIQNMSGPDKEWEPHLYHRVHVDDVGRNKYAWKVTSEGVHVFGDDHPRRTKGSPRTLRRVWKNFREHIYNAVDRYIMQAKDPARVMDRRMFEVLVATTLANENGGKIRGDRFEPHINDWSFGPAQFITATAHSVARKHGIGTAVLPARTMRQDGSDANKSNWRAWLENPTNAVPMCAAYLGDLDARFKLKGDPVFIYAGYNAGSPRPTIKRTPWGVVAYDRDGLGPLPGALDHFVEWYGDACATWDDGHGELVT